MTKRITALLFGLTILCTAINAQSILEQQNDIYFGESCTSIMVSKGASADGSVITSHTCDGRYRTWMTMKKVRHLKTIRLLPFIREDSEQRHPGICEE